MQVRHQWSKASELMPVAQNMDITTDPSQLDHSMKRQWLAGNFQQRLVLAHTRALSARQDIPAHVLSKVHQFPTALKNQTIDSIPPWKFSSINFSFVPTNLSS